MAQNKILNIEPIAVPNAVGNLLNGGITSLAGPIGYTQTQPYLILKHIRAINKTAGPVSLTLYKGATGGSAAGTEFAFVAVTIPANSALDWYGQTRFDSVDFLTGVAGAATSIVLNIDAEIGVS
jgi:hypothetical protein